MTFLLHQRKNGKSCFNFSVVLIFIGKSFFYSYGFRLCQLPVSSFNFGENMPGKLSVNFLDVWKKCPPILLLFINVFMHPFFLWPYQKLHDAIALLCRPAMPMASTVFHCMTRLVSFSCFRGAMEILDIQDYHVCKATAKLKHVVWFIC